MKKLSRLIILVLVIIGVYSTYNFIKNYKDKDEVIDKNVTNKIEEKSKEVKLTLVGDLLFESPFYKSIENGDDKNNYFSLV